MKYFGRRVELTTDSIELTYPEITINFEINFSDDDEGNAGDITLYNLSQDTIDQLKEGEAFKLVAGYKNYSGVILPGVIEAARTMWEGVDKVTRLVVGEDTHKWLNRTVERTWNEGTDGETIAADIIEAIGLSVGEIDLPTNPEYPHGHTVFGRGKEQLKEIANDGGAKLHTNRGKVFLRPPEEPSEQTIRITQDTGLINTPEKGEEEGETVWTVTTLLNYQIRADKLLQVESRTLNADVRVKEGRHMFEGNQFETQSEVKPL